MKTELFFNQTLVLVKLATPLSLLFQRPLAPSYLQRSSVVLRWRHGIVHSVHFLQ